MPSWGRQLLLREMYLSMGYLTFDVAPKFPYRLHAYKVFPPGVSWNDMRGALGNSMHVAQVGIVGIFVGAMLLCSRRKRDALTYAEVLELMDAVEN